MGNKYAITYPRKRIARGIARLLGRIVLPLAFKLQITDQDNFPESGPLLVVGNHVAAMEAVLMAVFTPWQVEMLGAADIPHEKVTELAIAVFGCIPLRRGRMDRSALNKALDVLRQDGVVGIFLEGGIWDARTMRPQTGVAWLSYRSGAPVLPIGFGGTLGAIGAALRMKRPVLEMNVGKLIPAARLLDGQPRKVFLEEYAAQVLDAVRTLIPADDREPQAKAFDERFELKVTVQGRDGKPERCPAGLRITHGAALAKLLHSPGVLKIFQNNLRLPVAALQDLENAYDAGTIARAAGAILRYLGEENPYLLAYRFGPRQGEAMEAGIEELLALAQWAAESGLSLGVTPIRRFRSPDQGKEIVVTRVAHVGGRHDADGASPLFLEKSFGETVPVAGVEFSRQAVDGEDDGRLRPVLEGIRVRVVEGGMRPTRRAAVIAVLGEGDPVVEGAGDVRRGLGIACYEIRIGRRHRDASLVSRRAVRIGVGTVVVGIAGIRVARKGCVNVEDMFVFQKAHDVRAGLEEPPVRLAIRAVFEMGGNEEPVVPVPGIRCPVEVQNLVDNGRALVVGSDGEPAHGDVGEIIAPVEEGIGEVGNEARGDRVTGNHVVISHEQEVCEILRVVALLDIVLQIVRRGAYRAHGDDFRGPAFQELPFGEGLEGGNERIIGDDQIFRPDRILIDREGFPPLVILGKGFEQVFEELARSRFPLLPCRTVVLAAV